MCSSTRQPRPLTQSISLLVHPYHQEAPQLPRYYRSHLLYPQVRILYSSRHPADRHSIIGSVMIITLPWSNKGGLLAGIYLTGLGTTGFVLALSWCSATNTGHTKKTTTNAMLLIGYCELNHTPYLIKLILGIGVGNLCAPQMWKAEYSPRYYIPWGIILACYIICPLMMVSCSTVLR
jgi:hypothetical protein